MIDAKKTHRHFFIYFHATIMNVKQQNNLITLVPKYLNSNVFCLKGLAKVIFLTLFNGQKNLQKMHYLKLENMIKSLTIGKKVKSIFT